MNLEAILAYQRKDAEKNKIERELYSGEDKKVLDQMVAIVKESQQKSQALEKTAEELLKEFETLKASYKDVDNVIKKLEKSNIETAKEDDIETIEKLTATIENNISYLDKKITATAEKINVTLAEFEQAKKKYNLAKEKHKKHKEFCENKENQYKPKLEEINKTLRNLEKDIDKELFEKYKQKRQDRIFPILVPLSDTSCGGCFTQVPMAKLSEVKDKGFYECENCHRIIYIK